MRPPIGSVGANHASIKRSNRAIVFHALRMRGPLARIDLARQTKLTPGTVTNIVDEFLAAGLIREIGEAQSRGGRKPMHLTINPTARFAIGIDLARNAITGVVIDLAGKCRQRVVEPGQVWTSEAVLTGVCRTIERLLDELQTLERQAIIGIGIGAFGPVSVRSGHFVAPLSFGAWQHLALREEINARFGLPTHIDNNANSAALAELWFGAGQNVDNFILIALGNGVGAGLVLDGDLYRGEHDLAGEVGHISINANGARCACGNYGCLELYVAVPRILGALRIALATGEPSVLQQRFVAGAGLTIEELLEALRLEDPLAVRVFSDVTRYLASGLVTLAHTLDPQLILLGRELASAGDLLLDAVRAEFRRRAFPILRDAVRIEVAALPDGPAVGAAALALREFFFAPLGVTNGSLSADVVRAGCATMPP